MENDILERIRGLSSPLDGPSDLARERQRQRLISAVIEEGTGAASPESNSPMRRHRPQLLAAAALVLIAAASTAVLVTRDNGGRAQPGDNIQLVDFATMNDNVYARITDPNAAASELSAVFQKHHFNITVDPIPVSPSLVGSITGMVTTEGTSPIRQIQNGPCIEGGSTCTIGLILPRQFSGEAHVKVGRSAQSGERYAVAASAFAVGEVLHCKGVFGEQVGTALTTLDATGDQITWVTSGPEGNTGSDPGRDTGASQINAGETPPASDFVTSAHATSSTGLLVQVGTTAPSPQAWDQGC